MWREGNKHGKSWLILRLAKCCCGAKPPGNRKQAVLLRKKGSEKLLRARICSVRARRRTPVTRMGQQQGISLSCSRTNTCPHCPCEPERFAACVKTRAALPKRALIAPSAPNTTYTPSAIVRPGADFEGHGSTPHCRDRVQGSRFGRHAAGSPASPSVRARLALHPYPIGLPGRAPHSRAGASCAGDGQTRDAGAPELQTL